MELILASRNQKKIKEMETILATHFPGVRILSLDDVGFEGDIEENGTTYEENALIKARTAVEAGGNRYAAIADDSGLCVDALNGAPGVYSARYAGEGHDDKANNAKLMEDMKDVPDEKRTCRFISAVALARRGRPVLVVEGKAEGLLLRAPAGENGFGYDPIFVPEGYDKTFAELSSEIKNTISHRARAMEKFLSYINNK